LHSPYLDNPFLPLNVALPQMLEDIEANLTDVQVDAIEKVRFRQRAELIRWLLNSGSGRQRRGDLTLRRRLASDDVVRAG